MKWVRLIIVVLVLFIGGAASLFADPAISADIDSSQYEVGDFITLSINIEENPGYHGVYFDIGYDDSFLEFVDIVKGSALKYEIRKEAFLHANGNRGTSGSRLVFAYSLENEDETVRNGTIAQVRFRVSNQMSSSSYRFSFSRNGIEDGNGNPLAQVAWRDSALFTVGTPQASGFINIARPYDFQVFYDNEISLDAIFSSNPNYSVIITNDAAGFTSAAQPAAGGTLVNYSVPLNFGDNSLIARLYDQHNRIIAEDVVKVYRSEDDLFIKIISPQDHELLNTDMFRVKVTSPFEAVRINGHSASKLDETVGQNHIYTAEVWFKQGFNTIKAEAVSPAGARYTDEIIVYYHKDDTVFNLVTPYTGQVIKAGENAVLDIKGEIGSLMDTTGSPNTVTVKVIYRPYNPYLSTKELVKAELAVIKETDITNGTAKAPFMFTIDPVSLKDLDSGELEIVAYKNKDGIVWDSQINRIAYIDNSRLAIDLVQPNIYSEDVLFAMKKVQDFSKNGTLEITNMEVTNKGAFRIGATSSVIETESGLGTAKINKIITRRNGTLLALANENSQLRIYQKSFDAESWSLRYSRDDMFGYDICDTDFGLLIGVTNLYSNENSGLYLLQEDNVLKNVSIGEPIPHVQCIINQNGVIYLYGNNYSHLYSFNIFTLEDTGSSYIAPASGKVPFDNSLNIRQLVLNENGKTAVLLDTQGYAAFYQNSDGAGFVKTAFNPHLFNPAATYKQVVYGTYENGDYNAFLLLGDGNSSMTVMEHKKNGRLVVNSINLQNDLGLQPGEIVNGAGYKDNKFYFTHSKTVSVNQRGIVSGRLLFDRFYPNAAGEVYTAAEEPVIAESELVITNRKEIYTGFGYGPIGGGIYRMTKAYPETGSMKFTYRNEDVEGLQGFSFDIDPQWLLENNKNNITFSFDILSNSGNESVLDNPVLTLQEFLDLNNGEFTISREFNADTELEQIRVDFNELRVNEHLLFELGFTSGATTPEISAFTIYKKIPIKIARSSGEELMLPVRGFVHDPTVTEVTVQGVSVEVLRDGSFSYDYYINTTESTFPVTVYCKNSSGEEVSLSFKVIIYDSVNDVWNVEFADGSGTTLLEAAGTFTSNEEYIYLSGTYYGLTGAIGGYEVYKHVSENGVQKLELQRQGVFGNYSPEETVNKEYAVPAGWTFPAGFEDPGTGYEYVSFAGQKVKLTPGEQIIKVYVENPGGLRKEFLINTEYPVVNYVMPEADQEIVITNTLYTENIDTLYNGIPVKKQIKLTLFESHTEPFEYKMDYTIYGEIKSLFKFFDLKVVSYHPDVTFENGQSEIIIPVDQSSRFNVTVSVKMPEQGEASDYYVAFIPTIPFMHDLKKGVQISAKKSFKDTYIIPDFSPIDPVVNGTWTQDEHEGLKKPVRVKFSRYIPEGTNLTMTVNFESDNRLTGRLVLIDPQENLYKLVDDLENTEVLLTQQTGLKYGRNRVQWQLSYKGELISSSLTGHPAMRDFLFNLDEIEGLIPTEITFPVKAGIYYTNGDTTGNVLPDLTITKNKYTLVDVKLNGINIYNDESTENPPALKLYEYDPVVEGNNELEVYYKEKSGNEQTETYTFLYDSKPPVVSTGDYYYDENYYEIDTFSVKIEEHNYASVTLMYRTAAGTDVIIDSTPEVLYVGDHVYKVVWNNLNEYEFLDIIPTAATPLSVKTEDLAGNDSNVAVFSGIGSIERPTEQLNPIIVDMTTDVDITYQQPGAASFDNEENYQGRDFDKHGKFYNNSIILEERTLGNGESAVEQRNEDIEARNYTVGNGANLTINAGNTISLGPGFTVEAGGSLVIEQDTFTEIEHKVFTKNETSEAASFVFFFRYEHETYYDVTTDYIRILTFSETANESYYLAYKNPDRPSDNGNEMLYVIHENREDDPVTKRVYLGGVPFSKTGPDDWNMICLKFDNVDANKKTISLIVNDAAPVSVMTADIPYHQILTQGSRFYFGNSDDDKEGHFSIANPFYINKIISINDVHEFIPLFGDEDFTQMANNMPRYDFPFNSSTDLVGSSYFQMRTFGSDYFAIKENADYTEGPSFGSLKASTQHMNLLKVNGAGQVVFRNAANPVKYNMDVSGNGSTFSLAPVSTEVKGTYYFSNTFGNQGLQTDRYYSIYGNVVSIDTTSDIDARLVLQINGKKQSFELTEGKFHHIYNNFTGETPESVIMYIETKNAITFDSKMVLNEGNYTLPLESANELDKSWASTRFYFGTSGTIDFWYKPFNVNADGLVNYKTVLLDSEFVTIGSYSDNNQNACYYFEVYNVLTESYDRVKTNVPVTTGWHHIQFSYSNTAGSDMAYLYIDGNIAGNIEGPGRLALSPSMQGMPISHDNVVFGSDLAFNTFAEGYLDEIHISNFYKESLYEPRKLLAFSYTDEPSPALTITDAGSGALPDPGLLFYQLESRDRSLVQKTNPASLSGHGFDVAAVPSGQYRLKASMEVNGHRYDDIFTFIKNDIPHFILKEKTPFIIYNNPSDISFLFEHDTSYLSEVQEAFYAGYAIKISYTALSGAEHTKTYYAVQDFLNPGTAKWLTAEEGVFSWTALGTPDNLVGLTFNNIESNSRVNWEAKAFYFEQIAEIESAGFDALTSIGSGTVDSAKLDVEVQNPDKQFRIKVTVGSDGNSSLLENMEVKYTITPKAPTTGQVITATESLGGLNTMYLYFDDILHDGTNALYGEYTGEISLYYNGQSYGLEEINISWQPDVITEEKPVVQKQYLEIVDFSLLYLNKENNMSGLYTEFTVSGLLELHYDLVVVSEDTNEYREYTGIVGDFNSEYYIIDDIELFNGRNIVKLALYDNKEAGLVRTTTRTVICSAAAPEVVLTNTVPSRIAYNNVLFSWKGYHDGVFKNDIQYSYNFDDQGWTAFSSEWRKLELYNLGEGYHNLKVQALYNNEVSNIESATFFVDIEKPRFDSSKITIEGIYTADNVLYAVNITGEAGSVTDASLERLTFNNEEVILGEDGSFSITNVNLEYDGVNKLTLTAYDRVDNFTDHVLTVNNHITDILFPGREVKFAPMTIVGKIDPSIGAAMNIYVFDAQSEVRGKGDYSGWKQARINEDKTFFIEDVYVNPGTKERENHTELEMAIVLKSGKVFTRKIDVWANEIYMPIDMFLSTHASEGESAQTTVTIDCKANVEDIATWSIDFDGDGIYDIVDMVDNPAYGQTHSWTHVYSSLGLVKPRVRVITNDGNYFAVSDEIIIHEKIKESSNAMVENPISVSVVPMEDGSDRLFVLCGIAGNYRIEVYKITKNENYISNRLFTVSLAGYGLENPVKIRALDDKHLYIATNNSAGSVVKLFKANELGNYIMLDEYEILASDTIYDLEVSEKELCLTYETSEKVLFVPMENKLPVLAGMEEKELVANGRSLGARLAVAKDDMGLLAADFFNQRIVRFSEGLKVLEYFGTFGDGEKEFIKPSLVHSFQNRIFVYDDSRNDIQVFGPDYRPITTLSYNLTEGYDNYFEPDFLAGLVDMAVITKEEQGRLYYYGLFLSKQTGKLAMLRLPQWEELRVRARNNKIVFLKDQEVFTAKPEGSDLARIIASDALPRIEGTLDYPALSPDGKQLVFTSRKRLYNNQVSEDVTAEDVTLYDNLYVINIDGTDLTRVPLGTLDTYEIERPVFNFNGDKIIFSARPAGGNWQIYVYNLKSGGIQKLFDSEENARFPSFSPDDKFVVFTTDYDGDEDIEIVDTENTEVRVSVSANNARDSYPVWSPVYPHEISNDDLNIESKIGFVSDRNFHKGLYYVYLARPSEHDIRVVTESGQDTGDNPDSAAIEITAENEEGDYPAFTGDGRALVFEYFDGTAQQLKKYDFEQKTFETVKLPEGAVRPAGMKNSIANFAAQVINGDEVKLNWTRYTEQDVFYTVRFKVNKEGEPFVQKKVFTQDGTTIKGLDMGVEYLFRVSIIEGGEEACATQWKKVLMPEVAARPVVTIDQDNPYLVKLHAWKPNQETEWNFSWIIDNMEINVNSSQDYLYEFATSGQKTILLKASNKSNTYTSVSGPETVNIISDIHPVIEYTLAEDSSYIELNAAKSEGNKIDWSSAVWTISGPGKQPLPPVTGTNTIVDLNGFKYKVNVNLTLRRILVNGQSATDTIEKSIVVDLDFKDVKPVVTYEIDQVNPRLFRFSGENSLGNIDWYRASWFVYADGAEVHRENGVSSFAYQFPESSKEIQYSVALTVPRANDGKTETTTMLVSVEAAPVEPEIDYEILLLKEDYNITGAKILLSCSNSKGSNIDFNQAKWHIPVAGGYGEQPTQVGPTAIFNLIGIEQLSIVEVALTLSRRGGADPVTVTRMVKLLPDERLETNFVTTCNVEQTTQGKTLVLDALSSTGPNIEWEKTEWLIDGQYSRKGPVARFDVPESAEGQVISYTCTLYRAGQEPIVKTDRVDIDATKIKPLITYKVLSAENKIYELSVLDTEGVNIDWQRTIWSIYDGNENVTQKQGSRIMHTFIPKSEAMGYPVMVEMYFKGSAKPFINYATIDVEADELTPIITYDKDPENPNMIIFSAEKSTGSGVDWSQVKWTFGDGTPADYGQTVTHKYPLDDEGIKYRVTLTLLRRAANGESETKTMVKEINIASDAIKPVIYAKVQGDGYLVLSAEQSEGRGLVLDRSLWLFEGKGDNESINNSASSGQSNATSQSHSFNIGTNQSFGYTPGSGGGFTYNGSVNIGYGSNQSGTHSSNRQNSVAESFSNVNQHNGAICRRYVGGESSVYVTLFVYRMSPTGEVQGKSITTRVIISDATSGAIYQ